MEVIRYLKQNEIDKKKWDACIDTAGNGLVYAYTEYLDTMCDHWDGLVMGNYTAVMPLPWRKKYGIYYLYQPFLTAQLGLFGNDLTAPILASFLGAIPKKFRYWDYMLNGGNVLPLQQYTLYRRNNFVLNLQPPYDDLYKGYKENIRRNIKKARVYGCRIQKDTAVDDVMTLALEQPAYTGSEKEFYSFKKLYQVLHAQGKAQTYAVYSTTDQLLASAVFFFSHRRAYYILVGNHPNGRTLGASHLLIDAFIQDHAGQPLLLDFEGSDVRSLSHFYSSFGAREEPYAAILLNRLPWYVKWLKAG